MKSKIMFFCFAIAASLAISAQTLIVEENFDYPVGADLTAHGWVVAGNADSDPLLVGQGSLTYPGYLPNTGNHAIVQPIGQAIRLPFGQPVFESGAAGTLYAAFVMNVSEVIGTTFSQISNPITFDNAAAEPHIQLGLKASGNGFAIGIGGFASIDDSSPWHGQTLNFGEKYLVVLKYEKTDGAKNDEISLYLNPAPDQAEPTPTLTKVENTTEASDLTGFSLRQGTSFYARSGFTIDGIRIATTWEAAVNAEGGGSEEPEPGTLPIPYSDNFDSYEGAVSRSGPLAPAKIIMDGWVAEDANSDNEKWFLSAKNVVPTYEPLSAENTLMCSWLEATFNDYLFTPFFNFEADQDYTLTFYRRQGEYELVADGTLAPATLTVDLFSEQSSTTALSLGQTFTFAESSWVKTEVKFRPTAAGTYCIGFKLHSTATSPSVGIDDMSLVAGDAPTEPSIETINYSPANGATEVKLGTTVYVDFSDKITLADPRPSPTINDVPCTLTLLPYGGTIRLRVNLPTTTPEEFYEYGKTYTVVIPAGTIIEYDKPITWSFTTVPVLTPESYSPEDGATDVAIDAEVSVTFNRYIESAPMGAPSIRIVKKSNGAAVSGVGYTLIKPVDPPTRTMVIRHANFEYNTEYEVSIPAGVLADSHNTGGFSWSFTTGAPEPPLAVTEYLPANGDTEAQQGELVIVTFNRNITLADPLPSDATINGVSYPVRVISSDFDGKIRNKLRVAAPDELFVRGQTYTVVIPAGVVVGYDEVITWSFTVEPTLAVVTCSPADGAVGVAIDAEVSVLFNKHVRNVGMTPKNIRINKVGGGALSGVSYDYIYPADPPQNTVVIRHPDFEYNTEYMVTIPAQTFDQLDNTGFKWSFTTIAEDVVTPPAVVGYAPADGATEVRKGEIVTVAFDREITLTDPQPADVTVNGESYPVSIMGDKKRVRILVPDDLFEPGETYIVVIPAGIVVGYDQEITWSFTAEPMLDVLTYSPADGAVDVAVDAPLFVVFNKHVVNVGMTPKEILITKTADGSILSGVSYDYATPLSPRDTIVIRHPDFEHGVEYQVTIPAQTFDVLDETGFGWSFTTEGSSSSVRNTSIVSRVYPTLSDGKVYVHSAPRSTVSVTDISGRTLAQHLSSGDLLELDLNYADGVYLIIINDGRVMAHKVILRK
jgi:hypothetical protein